MRGIDGELGRVQQVFQDEVRGADQVLTGHLKRIGEFLQPGGKTVVAVSFQSQSVIDGDDHPTFAGVVLLQFWNLVVIACAANKTASVLNGVLVCEFLLGGDYYTHKKDYGGKDCFFH